MEGQELSADKSFEVASSLSDYSFYAIISGCLSSPSPAAAIEVTAFSLPTQR